MPDIQLTIMYPRVKAIGLTRRGRDWLLDHIVEDLGEYHFLFEFLQEWEETMRRDGLEVYTT